MKNLYFAEAGVVLLVGASVLAYKGYTNSYKVSLARSLSKELGRKITTKNLESVMSGKEILKELSKLTEKNYVASKENMQNGIFLADLHSHSSYSDGTISVKDLLNEAAQYGNKLNKINGKKFIFALTDHDGVEGVKEALKLIAQEPEKYKNIRFLPASEVSFAFPCHKNSPRYSKHKAAVQMPEMLVYNINPFSEKTKEFFESIYSRRKSQETEAFSEANFFFHKNYFKQNEYNKFFNPQHKHCFLNQHWKIWDYIHTKSRIAEIALEQGKDADKLYEEIMTSLKAKTPHELDNYLKSNNIQTNSKKLHPRIAEILEEKIFPKMADLTKLESGFELGFEDLVKFARKENAFLGFAHPAFTMENFQGKEYIEGIRHLTNKSNGRVKFVEKYHQAYPIGTAIQQNELDEYNKVIDDFKLINIGGRDNHDKKLF